MSCTVPASVVISTFEEGDELRLTVESVLSAEQVPREIVIADDGSTDGSCQGPWPPEVRVVREAHRGIAAARNRGALLAREATIIFLDAHSRVDDFWLGVLLDVLDRVPDALVGPAVRDRRDPGFVGVGARIIDAALRYQWSAVSTTDLVEVGLVPGGCLAARRSRFLAAGGFAPFDGCGAEDVEIALRWWRAGLPLLGAPQSVVAHQFRAAPPYRRELRASVQNILRTALLHLGGNELRACVLACAQFGAFPEAIAAALAEPWWALGQELRRSEVRSIAEYIERWAPQAFTA